MKKTILITLMLLLTGIVNAQRILSPTEVNKILKDKESGLLTAESLSNLTSAIELTACEVFIQKSQEWDRKDRFILLQVATQCKIPSLMEIVSIARYDPSPKVSEEASYVFDSLQYNRYVIESKKMTAFTDSIEAVIIRQEIDEELLSVQVGPWPVSKILWDVYRYWVTPTDIKKIFDAAISNAVFSRQMFDLATFVAISLYDQELGISKEYIDVLILIRQAEKYEPRLSRSALRKIQKNTN